MSRILPEIPLEIERMVEKMLHKDLNLRYQSAQELLADLKNFKQDLEFQDKLEHTPVPNREKLTTQSLVAPLTLRNDSPTSSAEYLVREVKKNKFGFALGAMILLAFIGLGYWLFATRSANAPIDSIAVLPFENKSATADSEYLADGLTESLIYRLSQLPNLKVIPKAAVFRYQGKEIDFRKIGDELGVNAVMTGRIIQRGNSLAISVELTDLRSNTLLWGEKYERKMSELLITQREISAEIANKLQLKLSESGEKILTKRYTESNEAYQLYLRGRFHWSKRNSKDFERAIGYFKQAIEKDPNYALAYTGLADTLALIPLYGDFRPRDYLPNAKQSALKALELDENLAEAHASLGRILNSYDFDWEGAEREFKEAVKLNPNYATAHQWYAELLAFRGRPDEALQEIKTALELDPFSLTVNRMKGNVLTFAKRYDEAIVQLNKTLELYPESALVRFNLGDAFVAQKMYAEAVEQYLIALELDGQPPDNIKRFKAGYQTNGWQGFWDEYLQNLLEQRKKLSETDETAYFKNESLAFAYAATKNKDKALEYLNKSFEERDPELITIKMSEVYDFLNDDPHFKELIKKIGLPE
jgi:TolB-like protein/lipopolysaccharide biosynthesis regulator YciM